VLICEYIVKGSKNMNKYVKFRVENQDFGILTANVEKITKLMSISKIPDSNFFVEGVINYQEEILPLINIKKLFNMQDTNINSSSNIIIINGDTRKAGIIVDEVDDIEEAMDDNSCTQIQSQYIEEVKILNGNIISILSPKIINSI
jgi:purine-binding chemotaxis protein CheW